MKLLKSIGIRALALLLFFAMITAVILWQAGAYDISFIKRPVVITTSPEGGEETTPEVTTKPFEGTLPSNDEEKNKEILDSIKTFDELNTAGYELSFNVFGEDSVLAKLGEEYLLGEFSLRTYNETKKIVYTKENGRPGIKDQSKEKDLPRVQLYYGYGFIDNGKDYTVYSPEGKVVKENFNGTLVFARSDSGLPVVKENKKFYEIDAEKGFVEINETEIRYKALSFDAPRYYGVSDIGLYPFAAEIDILTYVGPVTTTPPPTTPSETTDQDGTGTTNTGTSVPETSGTGTSGTENDSPVTTVPDSSTSGTSDSEETTSSETTAPDTTVPETTVPETTTPITTAPQTSAPQSSEDQSGGLVISDGINQAEAEGEGTSASNSQSTEGAASSDTGSAVPPETTGSQTSADNVTSPEGTTAGGSTSEGTEPEGTTSEPVTTPNETEAMKPVNGTIIKDGAYYKVTKGIRYGYKDKDGNVIIEPQFAMAYDFAPDGRAAVKDVNGNLFFIDKNGKEVASIRKAYYAYPAEFNKQKLHQRYTDGINMNVLDVGMYYYDNGHVMVRYVLMDPYTAKILYKTKNSLIDIYGSSVPVPGNYTLENYSDGVMLLQKNGMYGYMSTDMSWVCPAIFDSAEPFIQGLAVASLDGKYGMIDTNGNTVLPFCFKYISNVSDGRVAAYSDELGWQLYTVMTKAQSES